LIERLDDEAAGPCRDPTEREVGGGQLVADPRDARVLGSETAQGRAQHVAGRRCRRGRPDQNRRGGDENLT
jgi:hypothetical protein